MNRANIDRVILRMWAASSQTEIAAACGVDKSTVCRRAAELGLSTLRRPDPASSIDDGIRGLWADNRPHVIAARLGVETSTVNRRAKALGLASKAPPKPALAVKPAAQVRVAGGNLRRKLDARAEDAPRLEFAPLPPVQPPGPGALILADAPLHGACRFPVGEAPEARADLQLFCSAPVAGGSCPYCTEHAALVWPSRRRVRK